MYEQMRNELQAKLVDSFGAFDIQQILMKLDAIAERYQIETKETALTVYNPDELPEMVKAYLASCVVAGMSDKTILRKKQLLGIFFRDVRKPPAEVSANDVRVWLFEYQQRTGVQNRTLDGYRGCIRAFFQWATDEEYLQKNPLSKIKPIKYERKERQALTQLELEQIRQSCRTLREKAIVEFFYSTGCRVSELCVVKRSDIDWANGSVHLFGKGRKHRTSYLNAKTVCALKRYIADRSDINQNLFVSERQPHDALTKAAVEKIVRDIVERSGIEGKHITPHVFRHTTATQMLQSGVPVTDIQMLLGHENVATTMVYAHTDRATVQMSHQRAVI